VFVVSSSPGGQPEKKAQHHSPSTHCPQNFLASLENEFRKFVDAIDTSSPSSHISLAERNKNLSVVSEKK
jgi:hypothetical protein